MYCKPHLNVKKPKQSNLSLTRYSNVRMIQIEIDFSLPLIYDEKDLDERGAEAPNNVFLTISSQD